MIKKRLAVEGGHYDKWPKTVLEGGNFSFITNMLNTLAHKTNGISHIEKALTLSYNEHLLGQIFELRQPFIRY